MAWVAVDKDGDEIICSDPLRRFISRDSEQYDSVCSVGVYTENKPC